MYMSTKDVRWRFILHMNWKGQFLPMLINGLPSKRTLEANPSSKTNYENLPMPSKEKVAFISPHTQIKKGNYKTPTYLVNGTADDMIPWKQSQNIVDALREKGVDSGISLANGAKHLFDTFPTEDPAETGWAAVYEGYDWLGKQFGL